MRKSTTSEIIYSPTDLIWFMQSPFASWMERYNLERPGELTPDAADAQMKIIASAGDRHEQEYLEKLKSDGVHLAEVVKGRNFAVSAAETTTALRDRIPVIYQGALQYQNFAGYSDFLILGKDGYEVWDTKLGRSARPYYLVQLCCYAEMLEHLTQVPCTTVGVILVSAQGRLQATGDSLDLRSFKTNDYRYYYQALKRSFLRLMDEFVPEFVPDLAQRPLPAARADHGRWQSHAEAWFERTDHLSRVAKITSGQIKKIEAAGIRTMAELGKAQDLSVPKLADESCRRLRDQARIQVATRESRSNDLEAAPAFEVHLHDPANRRGLRTLPPTDPGDIYFDMEGYPLVVGGLEYLFGACFHDGAALVFKDWWAHDRLEEKRALEGFVDWAFSRWRQNPALHIYHYAAYEVSALRRLSTGHATREEEIDQLLRNEVFVDLYRIVREAILLGEDSYSIKKIERLYRDKREGSVATAGDSIVEYANWIASGEAPHPSTSAILEGIRNYNEDDCRSTAELVIWLRKLQEERGLAFIGRPPKPKARDEGEPEVHPADATRSLLLAEALDESGKLVRPHLKTLAHLLDFHRREDKPMWWRMFDRIAAPVEELADDIACISLVQIQGQPEPEKKSFVQTYSFSPSEDTKISAGSKVMFTHEPVAQFDVMKLDSNSGEIGLKLSANKLRQHFGGVFPVAGSLIPNEFVSARPIPAAIHRAARAFREGRHPLLENLLNRKPPISEGGPLVRDNEAPAAASVRIAQSMNHSVLCVQGPPGTGKTFTGAGILVSLLQAGKKVGVMSNSHKAILNLVRAVGDVLPNPRSLRGIKIGGEEEDSIFANFPNFHFVKTGGEALAAYQVTGGLVAGTAWPFSREEWDGVLDYLVVDEAGQVSLANIVGVSLAAKNLILLGDQMQLEQPIQGTHPGETGQSALQYYLQGHATIPPQLGIFLDRSYRMHPDVCSFISETVYEGRLHSIPETARQRIAIDSADGLVRKEAGVVFLGVEHEGNLQASDEEIDVIVRVFQELHGRAYRGKDGSERPLQLDDFLFVSPYNLQVARLRARLPAGAKVGSVDKFQGQEAPVTVFSLGSSFGEYGSRGLAFLLDRNRINVAISRAQCLAIVVGDPRITLSEASSLEEVALINLYCRLASLQE
jgi:predicted RecB family nuclease